MVDVQRTVIGTFRRRSSERTHGDLCPLFEDVFFEPVGNVRIEDVNFFPIGNFGKPDGFCGRIVEHVSTVGGPDRIEEIIKSFWMSAHDLAFRNGVSALLNSRLDAGDVNLRVVHGDVVNVIPKTADFARFSKSIFDGCDITVSNVNEMSAAIRLSCRKSAIGDTK